MYDDKEELKKFLDKTKSQSTTGLSSVSIMPLTFKKDIFTLESAARKIQIEKLSDMFRENFKEFPNISVGEIISHLMNQKNLTSREIIKNSHLSKDYFNKIINDKRRPSRNKAIQLCFGLKLSPDEACEFLKKSGHNELYLRNEVDFIVYAALHQGYSLQLAEELLDSLGFDTLQSF